MDASLYLSDSETHTVNEIDLRPPATVITVARGSRGWEAGDLPAESQKDVQQLWPAGAREKGKFATGTEQLFPLLPRMTQ